MPRRKKASNRPPQPPPQQLDPIQPPAQPQPAAGIWSPPLSPTHPTLTLVDGSGNGGVESGSAPAGGPAELEKIAAQMEAEDRQPAGDTPTPQTVGTNAPPPPAADFDAAGFSRGVAEMVFGLVAMRKGDHWRLTKDEGETVAQAFAPLARRLGGTVDPLYLEIGMAAGALLAIVAVKVAAGAALETPAAA